MFDEGVDSPAGDDTSSEPACDAEHSAEQSEPCAPPVEPVLTKKRWEPAGEWLQEPQTARRFMNSQPAKSSKPVFDRYTWQKLGRAVSGQPYEQLASVETEEQTLSWPPQTEGVAPQSYVPVVETDEAYSQLVPDIGGPMSSAVEPPKPDHLIDDSLENASGLTLDVPTGQAASYVIQTNTAEDVDVPHAQIPEEVDAPTCLLYTSPSPRDS